MSLNEVAKRFEDLEKYRRQKARLAGLTLQPLVRETMAPLPESNPDVSAVKV